ncbi:hypothetical protein [Helicobacter zhangjianzhongii]|uniref:Uncharacterized protein n=1 Tax=Helicobacter zhangjianzhongii TaxID=2974574 RepID=A0ACC6FRF7_9HELI|nr:MULTISPECIES: hypothetical protein [unclassified Helicobacter]MDL0080075.1 hypothetical protein [Helicobacter sp. CPD2-1]MDL0081864.1 hypothetical protein [Helicobacter sp. XJK30-2]
MIKITLLESTFHTLRLFSHSRASAVSVAIHFQKVDSSANASFSVIARFCAVVKRSFFSIHTY